VRRSEETGPVGPVNLVEPDYLTNALSPRYSLALGFAGEILEGISSTETGRMLLEPIKDCNLPSLTIL
jgi:hypothetical protein